MSPANWRKSSRSGPNSSCVEVGRVGGGAVGIAMGGVGIGASFSWLYSYSQDNTWQDFQHDSKEKAKDALDRHSRAQEQLHETERKHPGSTPLTKW